MRDGDAEGVAEEGGDGEPVGERADHAGLGGGGDIARPGAGAGVLGPLGEDVDHGHEQQEPGGGEFHTAYAALFLLVRWAEARHRTVHGDAGAGMLPLDADLFFHFHPFHPLHPLGDPAHIVPS